MSSTGYIVTTPRPARAGASDHPAASPRRSSRARTGATLALVTLAILTASLVRAPGSAAAIPEPTATAQAALAQVCVAFGPIPAPMPEPLSSLCVAVALVYTNLLSDDFRVRLFPWLAPLL